MSKSIAFLSTKSKGITPDIRIIKNHLLLSDSNCEFSYFYKNESIPDKDEANIVKQMKVDFCNRSENIVCIDPSLPIRDMFSDKPYSRICVPTGYDYIIKNYLNEKEEKKNTLLNFTHIICTSPIIKKAIESNYRTDSIEIIDGCCSPMSEDICDDNNICQVFKKFLHIYAHIENKKILSIIKTGNACDENLYDGFDLNEFLNTLDDDYIVITNDGNLFEKAQSIADNIQERFIYVDLLSTASELLYITDALITNSSYLASTFAVKRLPLYHMDCLKSSFTDYMNEACKLSFPAKANEIAMEINSRGFDTSICNELSYPCNKHSTDIICEIIK